MSNNQKRESNGTLKAKDDFVHNNMWGSPQPEIQG